MIVARSIPSMSKKILLFVGFPQPHYMARSFMVFLYCTVSFCFLQYCSFDLSPSNAQKSFPKDFLLQVHTYTHQGRALRYVEVEKSISKDQSTKKKKPLLLFIHGSPGGWSAYLKYLKDPRLQKKARMISIDRLGYGGSEKGIPEPSLETHSEILRPILVQNRSSPILLIGHSMGGSILAKAAISFPQYIHGIVMIAAAASPKLERVRWYNRLAYLSVIRFFLPEDFDTSNQELAPLQGELEKLLPFWKEIRQRVTVIQGQKDRLVPSANADFLKKMLIHAPLRTLLIKEGGHFILWNRKDEIVSEILRLLRKIDKR